MDEVKLEPAQGLYLVTCIIASVTFIATILHCLFLREYERKMKTQWSIMLTNFEAVKRKRINITDVTYSKQRRPERRVHFDFPVYDYPRTHRPSIREDEQDHTYEDMNRQPKEGNDAIHIYENCGTI